MSRKGILGLIVLMCFVVLASGCISSETESTESNKSSNSSGSEDGWKSVATFSGVETVSGVERQDTDPFQIKGEKFKIKIKATSAIDNLSLVLFSFFVYPEGENTTFETYEMMNFTQSTETGEFIVDSGPGEYYLKIRGSNLKEWEVEVFDSV